MKVRGNEAKGDRVVGGALDLARGEDPRGVAVDQQRQQHGGMIRRRPRATIRFDHCREIQLIDHFHHEARQMPRGEPFIDRGRQQKCGIAIDGTEVAHAWVSLNEIICARLSRISVKSPRLLRSNCPAYYGFVSYALRSYIVALHTSR